MVACVINLNKLSFKCFYAYQFKMTSYDLYQNNNYCSFKTVIKFDYSNFSFNKKTPRSACDVQEKQTKAL